MEEKSHSLMIFIFKYFPINVKYHDIIEPRATLFNERTHLNKHINLPWGPQQGTIKSNIFNWCGDFTKIRKSEECP
jgi:hypothetical protein